MKRISSNCYITSVKSWTPFDMELVGVLMALFLAGIVSLAIYFRRNRGHLETLGIPIDPPMFMFGSSPHAMHKVSTLTLK